MSDMIITNPTLNPNEQIPQSIMSNISNNCYRDPRDISIGPDTSNEKTSNIVLEIQCTTGLTGDTPLFIDRQLMTVGQLFLGYSGKEVVTYGINTENGKYDATDCKILGIPKEIYTQDIISITFTDELLERFHLECARGSRIVTHEEFLDVERLEIGSEVFSIFYNSKYKQFLYGGKPKVTKIEKTKRIMQEPVYLFISQYKNILIPFKIPGTENFVFLNMQQ